jgi:hypothetical protein
MAAAVPATALADGLGARLDRCRDELASAARRTWRISNSYAAISENDGHAAITRPVTVGSATATFAARLAALPATKRAHGGNPPRSPPRESASSVVDAATIIPSTDNGVSAATHPGCPCSSTSRCMCRYDTVPAIRASNPTHPIVVRRIHRSARPLTAGLPARTHLSARIGSWVRSPSDTFPLALTCGDASWPSYTAGVTAGQRHGASTRSRSSPTAQ